MKKRKAEDQYDADISSSDPTMLLIAIGSLSKRSRNRNNMDANFHSAENESIIFNSQVSENLSQIKLKVFYLKNTRKSTMAFTLMFVRIVKYILIINLQQQEKCYETKSEVQDPKERWRVPFRLKKDTTTFEVN